MGLFDIFKKNKAEQQEKLDSGLQKTKSGLLGRLSRAFSGKSQIDDEVLDELEEILISSDVGVETTVKVIDRIRARAARDRYVNAEELNALLRDEVVQVLLENRSTYPPQGVEVPQPEENGEQVPYVIMVVGVNGVGKTTTIGKLAHNLKAGGARVLLGAADTFRAAAVEQLKIWAQRVEVDLVELGMGKDPASVAYQAVEAGKKTGADVVIVDTAGRLHNKKHLMEELSKIRRVMGKVIPSAPHEVLLVLDASTGQNALLQAQAFTAATQVTALALTKLDGTAKGGVVLGISDQLKIPIKYIGVGEKMEDLQLFDPVRFVHALFGGELQTEGEGA